MHLRDYLREWRKNPHWSFSCFLALVLPLISLPGDISGLVGTNDQLDTGDIDMSTIAGAVQGSGAVEVTLQEGDEADDDPAESQNDNRVDAQPQSGEGDLPIKVAAVEQGSGEVDSALEEDEQGNDYATKAQHAKCHVVEHSTNNRHQGTQTQLWTVLSTSDAVGHEPVEKTSS